MSETKFCQSCGMPLDSKDVCGTNQDGSINEEYCIYCYKDGAFVDDCTNLWKNYWKTASRTKRKKKPGNLCTASFLN